MTKRIILLHLFLALFFTLSISFNAFGQVDENLPIPKEYYSKDNKRLIRLSNLIQLDNGKGSFNGTITKVRWDYNYDAIYFEVGRTRFEVSYSNISNAGRSHLTDLFKKGNRVSIIAYAGGSNGIYFPIDIRLLKR